MAALVPFAVFGFIAAAVVAIIIFTKRAAQQRAEALRAAAANLGWNYRDEVSFDTIPNLERFEIFATGRARKLSNLMTSPAGALRAVVCDYAYTTGGGKSQQTHRQTVFYVAGDHFDLPTFSLRPENFLHRVATMMGYQDIDIPERAEFSSLFLLRGEEEARVVEVFNSSVVEFFEQHPGRCAAAKGHELLYWQPNRLAKAEEVAALIEQGFELARAFTVVESG